MRATAEKVDAVSGASPPLINAMAGKSTICPILQGHYDQLPYKKMHFLQTPEARYLMDNIPGEVRRILEHGFLSGKHGQDVKDWDEVVAFFLANNRIIPALTANPGTYTMLERMYHFKKVHGPIDEYFKRCLSGGQALRNRYDAVTKVASTHVQEVIAERGKCFMIDIGSGPGRNPIDMCLRNPSFPEKLRVDCIDIDPEAIAKGEELLAQSRLLNIFFIQKSMTKLNGRYDGNVDYGLMIGILCGLTRPERIGLLQRIRPYFRKGARLVAASLLEEMAIRDLLCAYILRETTGWGLQYPPLGKLQGVFEDAGWEYEGYFQDEPTRFYEIGIGIAA